MTGYIHSFESFGTVDGPGVRYVVFFQGCPMRCLYCHNPDTWKPSQGMQVDSDEIIQRISRNKMFYTTGGITVTGGEPLLQIGFLTELFEKAKEQGIHTCLDTSGIVFDPDAPLKMAQFQRLIDVTDLVLLDIKQMDEEKHRKLTGHSNKAVFAFAKFLEENQVPLWVRHVLVPGITDDPEGWESLGHYLKSLKNLTNFEVLPYHTMAKHKYESLGLDDPLGETKPVSLEEAQYAKNMILNAAKIF